MAIPNPGDLTANLLNAAVQHYLLESGLSCYFTRLSGLSPNSHEDDKLIVRCTNHAQSIAKKRRQNEVGGDENFHLFSALDILTKDVGELIKEITCLAKAHCVETAKERKNDSVKTANKQKSDSAEATIPQRRQPGKKYSVRIIEVSDTGSDETIAAHRRKTMQKANNLDNNSDGTFAAHRRKTVLKEKNSIQLTKEANTSSDKTTTAHRRQPVQKANNNSAQTAEVQKSDSDEITVGHRRQSVHKEKRQDETAAVHKRQPVHKEKRHGGSRSNKYIWSGVDELEKHS
ncbi:hypothetical protein GUJ93_ZPchr0003g16759 [Zizania palustris]|uniref:LisH domain-containing protein n=1 Tax=Zizania palustris TaxID=103762 RepID=A0A8J5RYC4_ZIZPA|nr:hypothetical protein GUJ93_ZPchr0003g16759 [Zizania palustris]